MMDDGGFAEVPLCRCAGVLMCCGGLVKVPTSKVVSDS